jgi:hypothetical protein
MNVRLVAYRKVLTTDNDTTQFEIDLQEAPNIVVNYNWLDIKEPTQRKGSFSQTIKVPFSDRNNEFFQNWFNVNLDALIFDTDTKFNATVFVDTIEQMQGFIQLKAIYLNARQYEIVVFGNSANFFTDIKDKKLRQAFENDNNGVITSDEQLDHYLTSANVVNSWTEGTGIATIGTDPVTSASSSKDVIYPVIDYALTKRPYTMGMFSNPYGSGAGTIEAQNELGMVRATNLKPALKIQRLMRIIAEKAGYTITSTFMGIAQSGALTDTGYFSQLFMTLANDQHKTKTFFNGFGFQVAMSGAVTQNVSPDEDNWTNQSIRELGFTNESDPNFDAFNLFDDNTQTVLGNTVDMNTIFMPYTALANEIGLPEGYGNNFGVEAEFNITFPAQYYNASDTDFADITFIKVYLEKQNIPFGDPDENWEICLENTFLIGGSGLTTDFNGQFSLNDLAEGGAVNLRLRFQFFGATEIPTDSSDYASITVNSGTIRSINNGLSGYTNGSYGMQVVMAENMPDINQSDFVKDLVNRFNLVVLNDPDNANNLIIEPYQDYISSGTTQYWTDKLDLSKEQVVKSTNELQKEKFVFTDLEGTDHLNEQYTGNFEQVYGAKTEYGGDFSSGEANNFSIFVPFIAQGIPTQDSYYSWGGDSSVNACVGQMYKVNELEPIEREGITDGKPRLFYYSGNPIDLSLPNGNPVPEANSGAYSFHILGYSSTTHASTGNKFPICSQYNLDNLNTGITATTKALLWDWVSPRFTVPWWCHNPFGTNVTEKGYYYDYWSQYFNEIYNKEARIMECYLNLTPTDIVEFEANAFKNPVYIKNTLWRVLKIDQYLVGGNKSTKVTLLKAITKLNYDCSGVPGSFNADGTITFVNPADGTTEVTITNECCEDINDDWTFMVTNDSTGVGTCYHNLNTDVVNGGVSDVTGLIQGISANLPVMLPMIGSTTNSIEIRKGSVTAQYSTVLLECVTVGTTTEDLKTQNLANVLQLSPYSMTHLEIDIIGTIVKGASNIGATFYGKYDTILKRKLAYAFDGTAGGSFVRKTEGTGFPSTPTIDLTEFTDKGYFKVTVTSSSADYTIKWVAKANFIAQRLPGSDGTELYQSLAIYQNGDTILFENNDVLEWN